jgi:hypothetical protein
MPKRADPQNGGIKKTKRIIQFIHQDQPVGSKLVMLKCIVPENTFFRHIKAAKNVFEVEIKFKKEYSGYIIEDYGILDKNKL